MMYQTRAPDERSPYVQMLPPMQVIELAGSICKQLGFTMPDAKAIQKRMRNRIPTVLEHDGRKMWIDRYYIAVEDDSPAGFKYLYLTQYHARESIREQKRVMRSGHPPLFDSKTFKRYEMAEAEMKACRRAYLLNAVT